MPKVVYVVLVDDKNIVVDFLSHAEAEWYLIEEGWSLDLGDVLWHKEDQTAEIVRMERKK